MFLFSIFSDTILLGLLEHKVWKSMEHATSMEQARRSKKGPENINYTRVQYEEMFYVRNRALTQVMKLNVF